MKTRKVNRSGIYDVDACFLALADSTRRDIIHMLLLQPLRAGELAKSVEMSPQALSRHLRVLRKIGLVVEQRLKKDARVRVYSVELVALEPVQEWFWHMGSLWKQQFESTQRTRRPRS